MTSDTTQVKLRHKLPFIILGIFALFGLFFPTIVPEADPNAPINSGDTAWILTASAMVLLMTPGLAFFYAGMVRYKNVVSTLLQSFIALGIVTVLWVFVGFSLAFGESFGGIIGNPASYFMFNNVGWGTHAALAPTIPLALFAMFQLKFAIITPALITGALAERIRFTSLMLFIVMFTLFIYAPLAHWTWNPDGFLRKWGVLDFAGGTVVHISAGFAALAGALMLGKRKSNGHTNHIPANIPYVILGTGLLWFGWFGFNAGSSLAANELAVRAFVNTAVASGAAMLSWTFFDSLSGKKRSAVGASVGAVVGLVAITPAAGYVSVGHSIFIGVVAAMVSNVAVRYKSKTGIDDTLDVFPCHGLGGIVGMILTAVFADNVGIIYGQYTTFLYHLLALAIVAVFTFGGSYGIMWLINKILPMRVSEEYEGKGLDITQHGEIATDYLLRVHDGNNEKMQATVNVN